MLVVRRSLGVGGLVLFGLRQKDKIEFFVDDQSVYIFAPKEKNENTWPYNQPFYFIINVAVGGNFGGDIIDGSIFPQEFLIDYIRVYQ